MMLGVADFAEERLQPEQVEHGEAGDERSAARCITDQCEITGDQGDGANARHPGFSPRNEVKEDGVTRGSDTRFRRQPRVVQEVDSRCEPQQPCEHDDAEHGEIDRVRLGAEERP
jgi:hypothetical protein